MPKEWEPETLLDVLGSGLAREILATACSEPRSAEELAEVCDASEPTVYRRLDALVEYGLLTEDLTVNVEGNNYRTYETAARRVRVEVTPDGVETTVHADRDLIDRFESFWVDLEGGETE